MTPPQGLLSPELQRDIAERVRDGDQAAEQELVSIFERRVRVMLHARLRDRDAALEITQDTLLAVITALRKGQLRNTESLAAFVHGIARNLGNNHIRKLQEAPRETEITPDLPLAVPPEDFEGQERLGLVRRAMGQLEPSDRQILLRTLVDGQKPGEIARDLGLSSEVVRTRKSRALKRIMDRVAALSRSAAGYHLVTDVKG